MYRFRIDIDFGFHQNSKSARQAFEDSLSNYWNRKQDLEFMPFAAMCSVQRFSGVFTGEDHTLMQRTRGEFLEWLMREPVCCSVKVEYLQEELPAECSGIQFADTFDFDNRSADEAAAAEQEKERIMELMARFSK